MLLQLPNGLLADCRMKWTVWDAISSLWTGLHTVTNKCCFIQLSGRLIKIRPRQKLLSVVRFCEAPVSALLRWFVPRNGCVLGWKVLETCGKKLPQRSFSHSQITSPNQSHPPLEITYQSVKENSLLQIQHAWRPDLVTRLRESHTQQACKTRHEHKTTSRLLSGCGSRVFGCVLFCFLYPVHPAFPTDVFPIKWNVFTASMCSTQWKTLPTPGAYTCAFLLMAFYKSLQNSAVCHLSISVFKSVTLLASPAATILDTTVRSSPWLSLLKDTC